MKISTNLFVLFVSISFWLLPSQALAGNKEDIKGNNKEDIKDIAVVVNIENKNVEHLTSKQISEIFLSRRRTFPSGDPVVVLEQEWNGAIREAFFRLLNGMTLKRLNAYWGRLQFCGEVQPPAIMPNDMAMLDAIRNNSQAIGYISTVYLDESVRAILILKE
ncbi:MAG: hypothetical protein HQK67_11860 [Desulfamplus sp.]|nr:hypothetical protein [Desulfamplus sp.]